MALDSQKIENYRNDFEAIVNEAEGVEYWLSRELGNLLEYQKYPNFLNVIEKAKVACTHSGEKVINHFVPTISKTLTGLGLEREVEDIMLTRYACYLIAQNADPSKEVVAFAQSYFALQTRRQELIEEQIALNERMEARDRLRESEKGLSEAIYHRGVTDNAGFARIRAKGDTALFGGYSTQDMKNKLAIPESRPLADFLPTVSINAKALAADITKHNVEAKDLFGEVPITDEHIDSNNQIRTLLVRNGIIPENLPAEEDIKKLERRVQRKLKKTDKLPPVE